MKTTFLYEYLSSLELRREIHEGLNKPSHGRRYTYQSPEWRKPLSSQLIEPSEDTP